MKKRYFIVGVGALAVGLIATGFSMQGRASKLSPLAQSASYAVASGDVEVQPSDGVLDKKQGCVFQGEGVQNGRLETWASAIGISTDDLQKELANGKQLYEVASEHGITYSDIQAQQLQSLRTKLKAMVASGYLTQAQADQHYEQMQSRFESGTMMGMGFGHHGRW